MGLSCYQLAGVDPLFLGQGYQHSVAQWLRCKPQRGDKEQT